MQLSKSQAVAFSTVLEIPLSDRYGCGVYRNTTPILIAFIRSSVDVSRLPKYQICWGGSAACDSYTSFSSNTSELISLSRLSVLSRLSRLRKLSKLSYLRSLRQLN